MSLSTQLDLLPTPVSLKNFDNLLRCPICCDYLDISMMAQQCSHTFCSLCIRKSLSYKSLCPVCNLATTELDLRNNRILDDIVKSFRLQFSRMNSEPSPISPKTPSAKKDAAPKRKGTLISDFLRKGAFPSPPKEPKLMSPREAREDTGVEKPCTVDGSVGEPPRDTPAAGSSSSGHDSNSPPATSGDEFSSVNVECPVCSVGIPQQFIHKHLDRCLATNEKRENLRSSSGKRKPLAKLVYTLLSLKELKRRLKEFQLSTQGSREQLVQRHQDFVLMYNAQCDSLHPKSAQEIANLIEKNEKTRTQLQSKSKSVVLFSKCQTDEEIEAMHSNYRTQHSDEFSRLIDQVRARWKTSKRAQSNQEVEEGRDDQKQCSAENVKEDLNDPEPFVASEEMNLQSEVTQRSPSSLSDISISSSVSDVFQPQPDGGNENTNDSSRGKRKASSSRDGDLTPDAHSSKRARQS